ncbi:hypothetical protein NIES2100_29880 [Calothrix sp. NIES-2100]|uniref:contractile injection system tape measure protein n=1 Tax=Calothrix sp. NIES-2100 TaxID=1954172 RepID=UPI000B5F5F5F|nr:hypothetical protein NIES2100_29880 [Calothrix sp. NIES-2100]
MNTQRHIIGRTVLELDTGRLADVWSLQSDMSCLLQQQGVREMARLFDELVGDEEVVRLDRVVVDIGAIDSQFLADEFIHSLLAALRETLGDRLTDRLLGEAPAQTITKSRKAADWEVLLYFLCYGRLPWWCPYEHWQEWLPRWSAAMQNNTTWQASLRQLLKNNSVVGQRLIEQLPENFRHELILQLQPTWLNWHALLGQARQLMQGLGLAGDGMRYLERQAWLLLFAEIGADNAPNKPLPVARWMGNWLTQLVDIWERTAAPGIVQNQPANADEIPSTQDNSQSPVPNPGGLSAVEAQSLLDAILAVVAREEQKLWLEVLDQVLTTTSVNLRATDTPGAEQEQSPQQGAEIVSQQRLPEAATESFGADWEVLLYFLQSGRLPVEEISEEWLPRWSTVIQNETAWQLPMRQLLATNPTARRRLVAQFPSSWRHQLLLQLQPAWTNWYNLLAQARMLMQSLSLSNDCFLELENLAWELMLTEISADGTTLTPLPGATWTRNWLAQVVQNWRWGESWLSEVVGVASRREASDREQRLDSARRPGAGEERLDFARRAGAGGESDELAADVNLNQIAWERLRTSIDAVSRSQRALWLNAYNQVLNVTTKGQQVGMPQLPLTPPETDWQVLLYFLESGRLPDEQASTTWQTWLQRWETLITTETAWQLPLRQLLKNNVAARQRFITQFPEALRHQLVLQLQPAWTNWYTLLGQAKQIMQSLSLSNSSCQELENQAWELLLTQISSDNTSLTPLPAATWTSNWLTQLVQNWRWDESWLSEVEASDREQRLDSARRPGAGEQRLDSARQPGAGEQRLDSARQPGAGEQRLDSARRPGAGEQHLDSARCPGAGEQRLDSARQPGAGEEEIAKRNPRQHLRQLITTLPITETTLWLNALELVVTATSPDEGKTSTLLSISPDTKTTTPTEEPTPQQQPSAKLVEGGTPEFTNPLSIPPRRARGSTLSTEEETAGLYVNIAGIVLLHPFLTFYLDAVGLLDGESFRDELAQQTAIYLLYYLATKQTDAPEYELVLPKLLCGWPLNEPVSRGLDLPTTALTEGENLLQTVINYWEVLKSTSRDGLREGFLQRAGKLTHGDGNWKLQVEQQAIDILLSRLPWGLSMVKLPWMEEILIVEWH